MSLTKQITKNTLIHAAGKFFASILGVVFVGLLTRYLGTEGYGQLTTILAYLFFFATVGDLGLYLITINELGRVGVDQQKVYSNIFTMRLVSGIFLMLLACGLIWFFPYSSLVKLGVLVVALSVLLQMSDQILVALFQKEMRTQYAALAEIVGKILILGLSVLAIHFDLGFFAILWVIVVGLAAHFLINFIFARQFLVFKLRFDKQVWLEILHKSWPVATYMIFSMVYFKADTVILSLYWPAAVVGLYGAPYKILEVLIAFPAIFMGLVSPHLSQAFSRHNLADFKRIFQKAFDGLSLIVWPMVLGTLVLAKPIINLIAGREFLASAVVLKILIVATGIIFIAHLPTFAAVAIGKQKQMMKYYILAAMSALALYFIFIPKYSYYAAGAITVLVEFFILVTAWQTVRKNLGFKISFKNNLKSLLAALVMAIILKLTDLGLIVSIILGGMVYLMVLAVLGVLKKRDIFGVFLTNLDR